MTKKQICEMFTQKVSEYIGMGYVITPDSFRGSDGTSRVDLVKGDDFIRIYIKEFYDLGKDVLYFRVCRKQLTGYELGNAYSNDIIWESDLTIIEEEKFIVVGKNSKNKYYLTEEEYDAMKDKLKKRSEGRTYNFGYTIVRLSDNAKEIVLPFIKRQPRCKSVKLKDINRVEKYIGKGRTCYRVFCKDKTFVMH